MTWQLTIDSRDPARLVRFWAFALGYAVQPPPEGFATWLAYYRSVGVPEEELRGEPEDFVDRIFDPAGEGPKIWFQLVAELPAGRHRFHLDLYPTGRDRSLPLEHRVEMVEARVAAGAEVQGRYPSVVDAPEGTEHYFVAMHDPEGNEFCVA